jgi:hypothetical protein
VNEIRFDNVLLYEKHDVTKKEVVKADGDKIIILHGAKIYRVVKPVINSLEDGPTGFETLCQYDAKEDKTDLSPLLAYKGYIMASVDYDNYGNFVWNCIELQDGSSDAEVFSVRNARECTEEECELLNKVFPEYYDNAFIGKAKQTKNSEASDNGGDRE